MSPIEGTITVVADDDTLRTVMTEILMDIGARCTAFVSADDALIHMLSTSDKDSLVVADQGVPGQIKGASLDRRSFPSGLKDERAALQDC
jgi:FixJ family two-component response regulator